MEMAAGSNDDARLRMWVRAGLNEGCLAARLLALRSSQELYAQWYDRYTLVNGLKLDQRCLPFLSA